MKYGISFYFLALEELQESLNENIQHIAIACRGAKEENFDRFLNSFNKKEELKEVNNDELFKNFSKDK